MVLLAFNPPENSLKPMHNCVHLCVYVNIFLSSMKTPTPGPVSVLKLLEPSHFPWGASFASAFPVKEHIAQIFITAVAVTETQVSEVMEAEELVEPQPLLKAPAVKKHEQCPAVACATSCRQNIQIQTPILPPCWGFLRRDIRTSQR